MKFIFIFVYYFLAMFVTVALTLMIVGTAIDVFFWLLYKLPFSLSMKEVISYLKIASIAGGVCGVGGTYYYTRTMKRY
ncbi:hypothetical protein ACP4QI_022065 [Leclercia sp. TB492]|uniref:hypothetical protein n=1 Tax=Leclercia TaxID=83654 RepID=UPI00254BBA17|nr:hypothetical protein [Leclercia adecarboxylata]MDK4744197.1 hypothetical protein [Leclercia adecarboxylata]